MGWRGSAKWVDLTVLCTQRGHWASVVCGPAAVPGTRAKGSHPDTLDASGWVQGETQAAFLAHEAGGLPFACKASWVRNESGWKESLLSALLWRAGRAAPSGGPSFGEQFQSMTAKV